MMDFARRQLEKYGWTSGKGLGKHENGISEAIKPKLKRSVTGIGHDAAAEFNEHWWTTLYDKASKNVKVEEENGKTKKIKTVVEEDFTITNSTWRLNKKRKNNDDDEYSEYFIKKAVLTNEGTKVENKSDSESENEEQEKKDVFKMTDEELFKACGGRTAHKGARHGLKAIGKLARIEQQEQMLLTQTKYEGYSHAKKLKKKDEAVVEGISLADEEEQPKNKKKKKKKRCLSNGNDANIIYEQSALGVLPDDNMKSENSDVNANMTDDTCDRITLEELFGDEVNADSSDVGNKSKKKKKRHPEHTEAVDLNTSEVVEDTTEVPKKKKKKKKRSEEID